MINHMGREIKIGDYNINGELLTHFVRYNEEVVLVSDEWERRGVSYVSDTIGYPIKVKDTDLVFNGILSAKDVLRLMQHLSNKGNKFFHDALIQFDLMDDKEKADMLKWLDSLEFGKNENISAETELLLMQFE